MIGQKQLLSTAKLQIENNVFPKFSIIVGEEGSGKKTFMETLSKEWRFSYICDDVKVDTIRKMIEFAYKTGDDGNCVYIMPDADKMSLQAKNSILKIVEEPPRSVSFLMSAVSIESVLPTIRSRAGIYRIIPYSSDEKLEYIRSIDKSFLDSSYLNFTLNVCNTLSDISQMLKIDPGALIKHINSIIEKCSSISIANLLKSSQSIKLNEKDEGFPLKLYLKSFQNVCVTRMSDEEVDRYVLSEMVSITERVLGRLSVRTANRSMLYDEWILGIREAGLNRLRR